MPSSVIFPTGWGFESRVRVRVRCSCYSYINTLQLAYYRESLCTHACSIEARVLHDWHMFFFPRVKKQSKFILGARPCLCSSHVSAVAVVVDWFLSILDLWLFSSFRTTFLRESIHWKIVIVEETDADVHDRDFLSNQRRKTREIDRIGAVSTLIDEALIKLSLRSVYMDQEKVRDSRTENLWTSSRSYAEQFIMRVHCDDILNLSNKICSIECRYSFVNF